MRGGLLPDSGFFMARTNRETRIMKLHRGSESGWT